MEYPMSQSEYTTNIVSEKKELPPLVALIVEVLQALGVVLVVNGERIEPEQEGEA